MQKVLIGAVLTAVLSLPGLVVAEAHDPGATRPPRPQAAAAASSPVIAGAPSRFHARVLRVEDGDTIVVRTRDGRVRWVRVLGIDTPEILFGQHECGGSSASRRMHALLPRGTRLLLRADPDQPRVDRFGRLLRYVRRAEDRLDVGLAQIERGLAEVYVFGNGPFEKRASYRAAQRAAQRVPLGIWRSC